MSIQRTMYIQIKFLSSIPHLRLDSHYHKPFKSTTLQSTSASRNEFNKQLFQHLRHESLAISYCLTLPVYPQIHLTTQSFPWLLYEQKLPTTAANSINSKPIIRIHIYTGKGRGKIRRPYLKRDSAVSRALASFLLNLGY